MEGLLSTEEEQREERCFLRSKHPLYSLKKKKDFSKLLRSKNSFKFGAYKIKYVNKKELELPEDKICVAFRLSRKTGKSHERNLLKRRLKHIFLSAKSPLDYACLFIGYKGVMDLPFKQLKQDIENRINCLKPS